MSVSNGYTSLATMSPQGRSRRVWLLATVMISLGLLYYTYCTPNVYDKAFIAPAPEAQTDSKWQPSPAPLIPTEFNASQTAPAPMLSASPFPADSIEKEEGAEEEADLMALIKAMYRPDLHPIDAANFTDEDGIVHHLGGEPRFRKKLGKKVLILDVDSRPLTGDGQIMNEKLPWKGMRPLSAGMLSHWMFANIHGYDYKFIRAPDYADRWGTWVKVPMMKESLKTHDYVVFMDSDAMFHYQHLPLEWLLNYWNMTEETLAMMSVDPDEPQNYDSQGNRYLNTGFVIAQQSSRTQDMFKAWAECPEEKRYKGCARWKLDWAHEQAAFGNYIRYDFNKPDDFRVIPCTEANGAPEAVNRGGCKGTFVRHFWIDKALLAKGLSDSIMQNFVPKLHASFLKMADENIFDAKETHKLKGAELVELKPEEEDELQLSVGMIQKDEGFKVKHKQQKPQETKDFHAA